MVEVVGAGKRYVKYEDRALITSRRLRIRTRSRHRHFWAVRGVDFDLGRGESLGLIGANGAGKSTLLRLMAGVTAPTEGSVKVHGRVTPLIAVGVGFHPELTGRENVHLNAEILGLGQVEVRRLFDEIVDFAGVEHFIDTPVKFYSSGMLVRLGFAVAVHSDPELLLIDEVLAVGDMRFQLKCFERLDQVLKNGTSLVVVSHNLNAIRLLCPRSLVIGTGRVVFDGASSGAISMFHELLADEREAEDTVASHGVHGAKVSIEQLVCLDAHGARSAFVHAGADVTFQVVVALDESAPASMVVELELATHGGVRIQAEEVALPGHGRCEVMFVVRAALVTGTYSAHVRVKRVEDSAVLVQRTALFYVANPRASNGLVDLDARFAAVSDTTR